MRDQMWTSLGEKIEPAWAPEREAAVRAAIARRSTRRRAVVRAAVAVASTGMLVVGGFALVRWHSAVPVAAPPGSSAIESEPSCWNRVPIRGCPQGQYPEGLAKCKEQRCSLPRDWGVRRVFLSGFCPVERTCFRSWSRLN